jgi:hypothetical protein
MNCEQYGFFNASLFPIARIPCCRTTNLWIFDEDATNYLSWMLAHKPLLGVAVSVNRCNGWAFWFASWDGRGPTDVDQWQPFPALLQISFSYMNCFTGETHYRKLTDERSSIIEESGLSASGGVEGASDNGRRGHGGCRRWQTTGAGWRSTVARRAGDGAEGGGGSYAEKNSKSWALRRGRGYKFFKFIRTHYTFVG